MEKAMKKYGPIFTLPIFAAFIIGFIVPFFQGIYLSFCQFTTVDNAKWNGFQNYIKVFQDEAFLGSFGFTVAFAAIGFAIGTFKIPENGTFEIMRKAGGANIDEAILRYIKFKQKKNRIYIYAKEGKK